MRFRLTEHLSPPPGDRSELDDETATRRAAKGTSGLRPPVERFEARAERSPNKTHEVVDTIIEQLATDNPALAQEMSREHRS